MQPLPQLPPEASQEGTQEYQPQVQYNGEQQLPPVQVDPYLELNLMENNMGTLRVSRNQSNKNFNAMQPPPALKPLAQLAQPVSVQDPDFTTIRVGRVPSGHPQAEMPPPLPSIPPPRDEIDDLFDLINN